MTTYTLHLDAIAAVTDEVFEQLCRSNPTVNLQRTADGVIVGASVAGNASICRAKLTARLVVWNEHTGLGEVFDASTCFQLANGAVHSPTLAWVQKERWQKLTPEQQAAPHAMRSSSSLGIIAPDFVIEMMAEGDYSCGELGSHRLETAQARMKEYLEHGVRFGWLMDGSTHRVEIYRPGRPVDVLHDPELLSGENILPGLMLNLRAIW